MAENKHPVIIGVGELLWDMLPEGKRAGGAPINFVYHATRLGAQGYAVTRSAMMLWATKSLPNWKKAASNTAFRATTTRRDMSKSF